MSTITMTEAVSLYMSRNNEGEGFAPEQDNVQEAAAAMVEDGGTLVLDRSTTSDVVVVAVDGKLIAIGGDGTGGSAWAIKIGQA